MKLIEKIIIGIIIMAAAIAIIPQKIRFEPDPKSLVSAGKLELLPIDRGPAAPEFVSGAKKPELLAKSVLAIDLATGTKLYAQQAQTELPIASLTKLVTAMVVLDRVKTEEIVTVSKSDTEVVGSNMGLVADEKITVENLLKGLLIPSSNDAALALARFVSGDRDKFVELMNEKARQLGLAHTHFANPVGLDDLDNYSTANDLSVIAAEFLKYSLLSRIVATAGEDVASTDGKIVHRLRTSNKLLLENSDVVGVKTGYTSEAQGNLIVKIDHENHEVLTIVLNTEDREGDSRRLIDWVYDSYRW